MKAFFIAVVIFAASMQSFAAGQQVSVVSVNAYTDGVVVQLSSAGFRADSAELQDVSICGDLPESLRSAILLILLDAKRAKTRLAVSTKKSVGGGLSCINAALQAH